MNNNAILRLDNVVKSYYQAGHKLEIIRQASMRIMPGEVAALVGPSGSGKSTLLQSIGLLDTIDDGSIVLDNIDCSDADDSERAKIRNKYIGFLYQSHHLLSDFTAIENVMLPRIIANDFSSESKDDAYDLLCRLGLENRVYHLPGELSGGEQQRVAIARALINSPRLLLADEPTGNLDPRTSWNVFNIIVQGIKQNGLAGLIVTHNLELAQYADTCYCIKNGMLIKTKIA